MDVFKSFLLIFSIVLLDQGSKFLVKLYQLPVRLNYGITFGLLTDNSFSLLPTAIYFILLLILFLLVFKKPKAPIVVVSLELILAGGISNVLDRMVNSGGVVDFVKIWQFPVFNLADVAITIGVLLIIYNIVIARSE